MTARETEEARRRVVRSASAITPLTLLSRLSGYARDNPKRDLVTHGCGLQKRPHSLAEALTTQEHLARDLSSWCGTSDGRLR